MTYLIWDRIIALSVTLLNVFKIATLIKTILYNSGFKVFSSIYLDLRTNLWTLVSFNPSFTVMSECVPSSRSLKERNKTVLQDSAAKIFNPWIFSTRFKTKIFTNSYKSKYFQGNKRTQQYVFCNINAPGGNKVKIWQKCLSPSFLTLPHPQGHVKSVRCEQPLDELTVQVWFLYDHPNFKCCFYI